MNYLFLQKNSIDICLEMDLNTCDRFLEEECIYHGDTLVKPANIADARHCQELCEQFETVGCKYWTFQKKENGEHECHLLTSDDRTCTNIGGPKSPSINECIGKIE